jgi:hypothetical protein
MLIRARRHALERATSGVARDSTRLRLAAKQSRPPSSKAIHYLLSSILSIRLLYYPVRRANLTRPMRQDLEKIRADFRKIFQISRAFPDCAQNLREGRAAPANVDT